MNIRYPIYEGVYRILTLEQRIPVLILSINQLIHLEYGNRKENYGSLPLVWRQCGENLQGLSL